MLTFILASQSPRRRSLLQQHGFVFHTLPVEISEILNENLSIEAAVEDLAQRKAKALIESNKILNFKDYLVLSADTIVEYRGRVFNKPKDEKEAFNFLRLLSGQTHQVITAFCLWPSTGPWVVGHATAHVQFRELRDQEILDYVATGDPMDKAGAYGIQSLGRHLVATFTGSLETIAGLPVQEIEQVIRTHHWEVERCSI